MAPSVLGIGIPATSDMVPWIVRGSLQRSLDAMERDMRASRYEWEMLYVTPSEPGVIDDCRKKLGERKWDVVMVGMGIRKSDALVEFFEGVVNAVHEVLPGAKFAFNGSIEKTREAVDRVAGGGD